MAGFDSLYTGITGLNSYQSWIDMISNNIANVDTTGFKGQRMTFADLFYQNQTFPSAPTNTSGGVDGQQLGFGVKVNTVDTEFQQGGFQTTGLQSDLAINGDGFFILNNLSGSSVPTYTRDGAFSTNENGVLYDPATGLAVQGWEADASGNVTASGTTGKITIPVGLTQQAQATGTGDKIGPTGDNVFDVALGGNLDQTQWQQSFLNSVGASATNGGAFTVSTTMYDSLGNAHEATVTYTPDTTGAVAANVTAGGAGLVITPGATISAGKISASDNTAATTVTVTTATPGAAGTGTYTITDTLGNTTTAGAGSTVTFDGAQITLATPAVAAATQSFSITPALNGLPTSVENAAGVAVTPATRWTVSVAFTDGTTFNTLATGGQVSANGTVTTAPTQGNATSGNVGYVYFDQKGQFINSSSIEKGPNGGGAYVIGANSTSGVPPLPDFHTAGSVATTFQGNLLAVTQWGQSAGNNAQAAAPGSIALGFWQNSSLEGAYGANVITQNGFAAGTLTNFTIGSDGTVSGSFSNGQIKTIAQVAMARFQNEGGLSRIGDNQFAATNNSGLAQVGSAGTGVYGQIQAGALEQSNVNLATEFTNLIVAQRAFEANTRGITTADQNLETVINLRASEN
ncbi:MAG TPA: flagellar hook-basal body complex protein [Candidatus Acidoferrales bacterium]|jgi:flagellar hook protein FlgE|nr:flagellar hook-basal body complex protein [Candidatus Acidoferrales bacterium]